MATNLKTYKISRSLFSQGFLSGCMSFSQDLSKLSLLINFKRKSTFLFAWVSTLILISSRFIRNSFYSSSFCRSVALFCRCLYIGDAGSKKSALICLKLLIPMSPFDYLFRLLVPSMAILFILTVPNDYIFLRRLA